MIENQSRETVLSGEDAMDLWRKGFGDWNTWVQRNPNAHISLAQQHFTPNAHIANGRDFIDFEQFVFPSGGVDFCGAEFRGGDTSFSRAKFHGGMVDFSHAVFAEGDTSFKRAAFYGCDVDFSFTTFAAPIVDFSLADFGDGDLDFTSTVFRSQTVIFLLAKLGSGTLHFDGSKVGRALLRFELTNLEKEIVSFRDIEFEGEGFFWQLNGLEKAKEVTFEGCKFEGLFTFTHKGRMGAPLDLRRTKLVHMPVLNDLICDYKIAPMPSILARSSQWWLGVPSSDPPTWKWHKKAQHREDSQRFRRLKEIAHSNRNHAKALEFHIQEIRSRRGWETNWPQDLAQFFFWAFGDYGRSVLRPIVWMGVFWAAFAGWFWWMRAPIQKVADSLPIGTGASIYRDGWTALTYSASNMLSFIPTGRTAKQQGEDLLFGGLVPDSVLLVSGVQSIVAVILLFLLGLGLRNMFRV